MLPRHFLAAAESAGVSETVVVEASAWPADNDWILDLVRRQACIASFVGHVEPGDGFDRELSRLAAHPLFRGIRLSSAHFRDDCHAATFRAMGLGCATFGRVQPGYSDDDAVAAIRHAVDLGLDFLDTSAAYLESERRLGLALSGGYRDRVHLQTKAGNHKDRRQDYSADAARWSVENSLRLLRTDRLDSVLIHDPIDVADPLGAGRMLDELLRLKERGLIGHVGIGVRSRGFLCRAMETGKIDIVLTHNDYTLLSQTASERVLPTARARRRRHPGEHPGERRPCGP